MLVFIASMYAPMLYPGDNGGYAHPLTKSTSEGAAWPMVGGDPQHSGVARRIIDEGSPQLIWKWSVGEKLLSPVVGYDGTIYLTSNRTIYALTQTGELKWSYDSSENIASHLAVDKEGNVYFGTMFYTPSTWGGHVYSLDRDGNLRWKYDARGWVQSEPVVDSTGTIYFYSSSEYLYAFNSDGSLKWSVKIPGSFSVPDARNTPAIGLNGTIYFPATNRIVVLSPEGEFLRNITFQNGTSVLDYVAAMDGDTVYIGIRACGLGLYALGVNGEERWYYGGEGIKSPPAISPNGTIYVVTDENSLAALNSDGEVKWRFGGERYLISHQTPSISGNGIIYVVGREMENGEERYYLYAVNSDGELVWKYEIDGPGNTPAIGNEGFLYITTSNGTLYALKIGKCVDREPSPPGLRLRIENDSVVLEIIPPFDDGGLPIEYFLVYRSVDNGESVKVAEVENGTYEERVGEGEYRYYVTAVNSIGESEKSNTVGAQIHVNEGNPVWVYALVAGVGVVLAAAVYYGVRKKKG